MHPLQTYIMDLRQIRASGSNVPETSYYPALSNLMNEVGKSLKPKVTCIMTTKNIGSGIPDGGLFTPDQFQKGRGETFPGTPPSRGVIEAKGLAADVHETAQSAQVRKYLDGYGQVLVTNFRQFLLVVRGRNGETEERELYSLGDNEQDFWTDTFRTQTALKEHGERFIEFLKRVMLNAAPLAAPKDLAWFLASYAREARARIEAKKDLPALASVRASLEKALGITFQDEKGEHFFRSTLIQTLFYGVFSAWVLWSQKHPYNDGKAYFDWRTAGWSLRVPVISALFSQVATPYQLQPLGLVEVLDWAGAVLNRVDRLTFFSKFEKEHAVQYFYEPFLEAYDPDLRKQLGVWYTPPEIVQYMVARVDAVLRSELDIADGLADPRVVVLDPCCGTGAYLVETLKHIQRTLEAKGGDALLNDDLKQAAMNRVFGFEIMPAPFVISHLQLGLMLDGLGAPFGDGERAGVFLTNSLTGWEPMDAEKEKATQLGLSGMPELQQERDAAAHVKRDERILVVIGNPPYNAFAGVSPEQENGLVEPYKQGLISKWGIKKFNLDDLYVRFFRLAERRIAEMTKLGIVCYISSYSYLSDQSYVVMRERLLKEFDKIWIDCLNGDSRETGKLTPEGLPDPSVFSTQFNREGIRVGTAIGMLVRRTKRQEQPEVLFRQFWGITKRAELLAGLNDPDLESHYTPAIPSPDNRHSFRPSDVADHYLAWPKVIDLCAEAPSNGLMEKRGGALIDIDRLSLERRIEAYFDPEVEWSVLHSLGTGLTKDAAGYDAKIVRAKAVASEKFSYTAIHRYAFRPLDSRWCYYAGMPALWNRCRPQMKANLWPGNAFVLSRVGAAKEPEGSPFLYAQALSDDHILSPDASGFPLWLKRGHKSVGGWTQSGLGDVVDEPVSNYSPAVLYYLRSIMLGGRDLKPIAGEHVWMHVLAIGYSPAYLTENSDGIRQDWPRIPLPDTKAALLASAELGRKVAALLDTESEVPGVTSGSIRPEMQVIGVLTSTKGRSLSVGRDDLAVTAGWGHGGKDGVTMPGKGRIIEREYTPEERQAICAGAAALGLEPAVALAHLGEKTCDIYLNGYAYWRCVPAKVWGYYIGGYQVIKKWLSYREKDILGRPLTKDEAREVMNMARRLSAIILLEPALDENYRQVKEHTYPWPKER